MYKIYLLIVLLSSILLLSACSDRDADTIGRLNILVDASGQAITNVGAPINDDDAANKQFVIDYCSQTYWDDLRVPVNSVKLPGLKAPAWVTTYGGMLLLFSDQDVKSNEEEVYFFTEMPHGYVEGTDVTPHIHFAFTENQTGTSTRWCLEYRWTNVGQVLPPMTTIYAECEANNNALTHLVCAFPSIDGTGKKISSIFNCRLCRNSSDPADDFTGEVVLASFDIHFQTDGKGSKELMTK